MKKILRLIYSCILAFLIIAGCSAAQLLTETKGQISITLLGDKEIYLEFGNNFQEFGAEAIYTDMLDQTAISVPIEINGQVNDKTLGDYTIHYSAELGNSFSTASRTVHVIDTVLPVINLVSNPEAYTLPGVPYQEEGFTASDNYDGDLTAHVECFESDGIVTYTVSDSSGNTATATRSIRYFDPEPPVLQLLGDSTVILMKNQEYIEAGFTATDNVDGDLTSAVTVSGSVDTTSPGAYLLQYSVSDAFGNVTSVERTVYILSTAGSGEGKGGIVYLTFDDGPSNYTNQLLDILAKYNVKATFFVVNTGNIGIISRAAAEGHTVAVHTATHNFAQVYASDEAYLNDLLTMQEIIFQHTGQRTMMFRFPGGSSNTASRTYNSGIMTRLTQSLPAMGFQYYDWNVDSRDAGGATSSDEVFFNVVSGISKHQTSIVLQHDTTAFSVNAVERIIEWGLANGYTFHPLTLGCPTSHHGVRN